jgi:hypothetical protein
MASALTRGPASKIWSVKSKNFAMPTKSPSKRVRFCPGEARPPTQVLRDFVDQNRKAYGVEPICNVLQITPSEVARCKVERLMKRMDLHGVRRSKVIRTTAPDKARSHAPWTGTIASSKQTVLTSFGCQT